MSTATFKRTAILTSSLLMLPIGCSAGADPMGDGETDGDEIGDETGDDTGPDGACELSPEPIRRLTENEYVQTVTTLFAGVALPELDPVPDGRVDGFVGHTDGQSVSALGVQRYETLASEVGEAAAAELGVWAPCTEDSTECAQAIALELGWKIYRRPLSVTEQDALGEFAADSHAQFGLEIGVSVVVEALLQSPLFLYRPEFGIGDDAQLVALDDYEMASRLSYFFLDDMPDAELFDAAAAGELMTDEGLEAQARRLLYDERARPVLTGFFAEWLRLYKLDELALDATRFPEFGPELRVALEQSATRYLEQALWEEDSWEALMTGSFGFVNDTLAPIFGVPAPGSNELVYVDLDPLERRGVLTQPALLASTSHGIAHSPIFRGVTMLDNIMCTPMASPPPGLLDETDPLPVPPEEICTTRDLVSKTHTNRPACEGCHTAIDGAGFTFEHYDALGRFRSEENGCTVDSSGVFSLPVGEVSDAIDLAGKLADADRVANCMSAHLFRYASGRSELGTDTCQIEGLSAAMRDSDGSLQEMLVQMVLSEAFRNRPPA